jgi:hypothetical protein
MGTNKAALGSFHERCAARPINHRNGKIQEPNAHRAAVPCLRESKRL